MLWTGRVTIGCPDRAAVMLQSITRLNNYLLTSTSLCSISLFNGYWYIAEGGNPKRPDWEKLRLRTSRIEKILHRLRTLSYLFNALWENCSGTIALRENSASYASLPEGFACRAIVWTNCPFCLKCCVNSAALFQYICFHLILEQREEEKQDIAWSWQGQLSKVALWET